MRANSRREARKPFIFQLPATSGRFALARHVSFASPFQFLRSRYQSGRGHASAACDGLPLPPHVATRRPAPYDTQLLGRLADGTSLNHGRLMLRGIRKASSNWLGKLVMAVVVGVLVVSFAIWGIGDIFRGFGRSTVAKIGNTEITVEQFRMLYNERLQQYSRQLGRPIGTEQARAHGPRPAGDRTAGFGDRARRSRQRSSVLHFPMPKSPSRSRPTRPSRGRMASSTAFVSSRRFAMPAIPRHALSPSSAAGCCAASSRAR